MNKVAFQAFKTQLKKDALLWVPLALPISGAFTFMAIVAHHHIFSNPDVRLFQKGKPGKHAHCIEIKEEDRDPKNFKLFPKFKFNW